MFGDKQIIKSGDNCVNIQIYNKCENVDYSDVEEVATKVCKEMYKKLAEVSANEAEKRVNDIVNKFVHRLNEKQYLMMSLKDPDVQYDMYIMMKEYSRCPNEELAILLIESLILRMNEKNRSLRQIVINQAIEVIPKLTTQAIDILTVIFFLKNVTSNSITIDQYMKTYFVPVVMSLRNAPSYIVEHLDFAGCLSLDSVGFGDDYLKYFKHISEVNTQFSNELEFVTFLDGIDKDLKLIFNEGKKLKIGDTVMSPVGKAVCLINLKSRYNMELNLDNWI